MKELVIFDLDDTLSESKTDLSESMARLLKGLMEIYDVAIISGCSFDQFKKQFIAPLVGWNQGETVKLSKLFLLPASGTQLWIHSRDVGWHNLYAYALSLEEKVKIYNAFEVATRLCEIRPLDKPYGEIAEDRLSQITFSMCGQQAPIEVKKPWDPDQKKRLVIAKEMDKLLAGQYAITVGGASSIDVSKKGFDKAFGVTQLLNHLPYDKKECIFVGDALFEGGNDYCVKQLGIDCIAVKNPEETKKFIESMYPVSVMERT